MGSYKCKASTIQHSSSSFGIIVVKEQFKVIVTPPNVDVEVGGTATFTCKIYPPLSSSSEGLLIYTWSRIDDNAILSNTKTLRLVSNLVAYQIKLYINSHPTRILSVI